MIPAGSKYPMVAEISTKRLNKTYKGNLGDKVLILRGARNPDDSVYLVAVTVDGRKVSFRSHQLAPSTCDEKTLETLMAHRERLDAEFKQKRSEMNRGVVFCVRVIKETDSAWNVQAFGAIIWLPKSQVKRLSESYWEAPVWLLREKVPSYADHSQHEFQQTLFRELARYENKEITVEELKDAVSKLGDDAVHRMEKEVSTS